MTLFDRPQTSERETALLNHLEPLLATLKTELGIKSIVDLGCGVGNYSRSLSRLGFNVTGVDIRENNISEAMKRDGSSIPYHVADIEELGSEIDSFDLTFSVGLLYHFENPFRAIRNIANITKKVTLIETQAISMGKPLLYMVDEKPADDQSINAVTIRPSEESLVKLLYLSGFLHVYKIL